MIRTRRARAGRRHDQPRLLPLTLVLVLLASLVTTLPGAAPASAQAALGIAKEASSDTVESGETVQYRILVSCSSATGDCVDAAVTDVLPPELSRLAADVFIPPLIGADSTYDEATGTATWTFTNDLGNGQVGLATGSTVELLLEVKFPPGSTPDGTIAVNSADFVADTDDDGVLETVTSPDVPVTATATFSFNGLKTVRGGVANLGLPVTYDIELCSDPTGGLDMEAGATLQDVLPAGANFQSATNGGVEVSPGVVEWTLPAVPADGTCVLVGSVTVRFPPGRFNEGDMVTNAVSVLNPVPLGGDPNNPEPPIDATLTHPLSEPFAGGATTKIGPEWITPGQPFVYSVVIDSNGFLPIRDAVLTDTIPLAVDLQSITIPAGVNRLFITSDLDPMLRPVPFTAGVPIPKATLVGAGDFVASIQVEADTVDAGTVLTIELGAVVLEGTNRTGGVITEGSAQGDGDVITNCSTVTYNDDDNLPQTDGPSCVNTFVKAEFAVPRITKDADSGPYLPGATVTWEVTALNAEAASTGVDDFVITDLVPDSYDDSTPVALVYEAGSATVVDKPAGAPDPVITVGTDAASGRTVIEWRWTAADATSYSLQPGETVTVAYDATFPNPTPPGVVSNHAGLSDWANGPANPSADKQLIWNCDAPLEVDQELLDLMGVTLADLQDPEAINPPCYDDAPVIIEAITGLGSVKWVRGEADLDIVIDASGDPGDPDPEAAGYTRFPQTGLTYPGGYADYRIVLTNPGNVPIDDLVILDILPFIGDTGVLTGARDSAWRPTLTGPVMLPPPLDTQAVVYYSTSGDPCRDDRLKIPAGCTDWDTVPPNPISDVQSLMIDFDDELSIGAGGSLQFEWSMTAPAGTPIDGSIAWNSFGFSSARADTEGELLAAEPRKVGIEVRVAPNGLYGDYVWFDFDHDGFQDPEEMGPELVDQPSRLTGINGVRVQFYEDLTGDGPTVDDRFVRLTYTQDDFAGNPGFYSFPELDPGLYYAVMDVPAGLDLTLQDATGDGGANDETDAEDDSDAGPASLTFDGDTITAAANPDQVMMPVTRLALDEKDLSWDVGFWDPTMLRTSLGDFVFYDNDFNGDQTAPTSGVENVTVNLWWVGEDGVKDDTAGDDLLLQTTATDANGAYKFDWLVPGPNYYVEFVAPAGTLLTLMDVNGNADDTIDSDPDRTTGLTELIDLDNGPDPVDTGWDPDTQIVEPQWDAGLFYPVSLGDFVWEDLNYDGIQDAGEPGIGAVTVTLYSPGADGVIDTAPGGDDVEITTTTTDGTGFYEFTDLDVGDYFVVVTPPAGYMSTLLKQGGDDTLDSDGVDGVDPYVGQIVMNQVTTLEVLPGADGIINTADDEPENEPQWDFGLFEFATLGDFVWEDLNRDGIQDAGEPGVAGVTVNLLDAAGVQIGTTTTDGTGFYEFTDLLPGPYSIEVDPTTAPTTVDRPWFFTLQDVGGDTTDSDVDPDPASPTFGTTVQTFLESGENDPTWDAGIWRWATIGDYAWHDVDGDGTQGALEPGIDGVTVVLFDGTGAVVATTVTAPDPMSGLPGFYLFEQLVPGTYSVAFDLASMVLVDGGYVATDQDIGDDATDSDINPITGLMAPTDLVSNETDLTWDGGFYIPVNLGDYVWYDSDINGIQDPTDEDPDNPGPPGVNGVTVNLLDDTGTQVGTTVTADDPATGLPGWYLFEDLQPGTYEVEFVLPNGFTFTLENVGGDDTIDSDAALADGRTGPIVLTSGNDDFTWDAGIYIWAGLGDFVWDDLNADGIQDAGEPGINGVTVFLLDDTGMQIDSTVTGPDPMTGADGYYSFDVLPPGTYSVQFDLTSAALAGYEQSPPNVGGDDAVDSDGALGTGLTAQTTLDFGDFDPTLDAGFYLPAELGDFVWDDLDGNGIQDAGEPGIEGVTVFLLDDAGAQIGSVVTDATGFYEFVDLDPGTYSVQFDLTSAPLVAGGYVPTTANAGADDAVDSDGSETDGTTAQTTLISGQRDDTIDSGFYVSVTVGNFVWEDQDGNGLQSAGEPGVPGVTVYLLDDMGNRVVDGTGADVSTVTDAFGRYRFADLPPGIYAVEFDLATIPAGFVVTLQDVDGNLNDDLDSDADGTTGITSPTDFLLSGERDLDLDMGLVLPVVVGDFVWDDLNGDGLQDAAEPGIGGVTVDLFLVDPATGAPVLVDTAVTTALGQYLFSDLPPGEYFVTFDLATLPAGYVATFQDAGDDALDSDADPVTGETATTGFLFSQDSDLTLDMGAYLPVTVGDFVWEDLDGNGLQDAGEPGVPGVTVYLLDDMGNRIVDGTGADVSAVTDAGGLYLFEDLPPGSYAVEFDLATLPAGSVPTFQNVDGDVSDAIDSDADPATGITAATPFLESGDAPDLTLDMGIYTPVVVGDFVWDDLNGDGLQDVGEPGIENVGVTLSVIDPVTSLPVIVDTAVTDAAGVYLFEDLPPGEYFVTFDLATLPAGYVATFQDAGDDALDSDADRVTGETATTGFLASGDADLTLDLGAFAPVAVGDFVWEDLDGNGLQDAGEPGVPGVTVYLLDAAGNRVDDGTGADVQAVTDADGLYLFEDLPPGAYAVEFDLATVPAGWFVTAQNVDGNVSDALDSDADPATGITAPTPFLESGAAPDLTLDMGIFQSVAVGDFVWEDTNGNGLQDVGEPGIEAVTVTLYATGADGIADPATDTVVDVTATDADGGYLFIDLDPGDYFVVFDLATLPVDYVATFVDVGADDTIDSDADTVTGVTRPTGFLDSQEQDLDLDLGAFIPVSVGDYVWHDVSGDGLQDAAEPGVPDVGVTLFDAGPDGLAGTADDVEVATTVTDADGLYLFEDLPPASYFVVFDLATVPDGWIPTVVDACGCPDPDADSAANQATGATVPTGPIPSGDEDLSLDMGLVVPVVVGDRVWEDLNADGIQDAGEVGIAGVSATLWDVGADGVAGTADDVEVATTATGANGDYLFDGLNPGDYYVAFDLATLPQGYVATLPNQGADDTLDSDADPVTGITPSTGFLDGSGVDTADLTLDLGAYVPVSVGDLVWEDRNGDGAQDPDEPGTGGVTVRLLGPGPDGVFDTGDDTVVDEIVTADSGMYLFEGLPPGDYVVEVDLDTLPVGALVTAPGAAAADVDSDIDPTTGRTDVIPLPMGEDERDIDAGFFIPYDLVLSKILTTPLVSGDEAIYEISVGNVGAGPAYGPITLIDELPVGLSPVSAAGDGWFCAIAGQTVTCTHAGELAVGAVTDVTLVALVTAAPGATIVNSATVFGVNGAVLGGNLDDDAASAEGFVSAAQEPLPRTGQDLDRLVWLSLLALMLGGLLVGRGRRPRRLA